MTPGTRVRVDLPSSDLHGVDGVVAGATEDPDVMKVIVGLVSRLLKKDALVPVDEPVPNDPVDHPTHYTSSAAKCSACGHRIECIDVTESMPFTLGNAVKYLWRAGLKGSAVEDLKKAIWYIDREIKRREKGA